MERLAFRANRLWVPLSCPPRLFGSIVREFAACYGNHHPSVNPKSSQRYLKLEIGNWIGNMTSSGPYFQVFDHEKQENQFASIDVILSDVGYSRITSHVSPDFRNSHVFLRQVAHGVWWRLSAVVSRFKFPVSSSQSHPSIS